MKIKRLEVQGFKSFKDKTVIHFDHSITGIVGPNGCGKSNIVDAFFWVMGEQSYKHMRGGNSGDLIFNGSSKYSPLGMAEATLVMETSALPLSLEASSENQLQKDIPIHLRAKEISVTRRLYRSGEGEYFINGVPARLKDIHELFMDTGVGARGYSVIEQGQIGKIVNAKPEERRLLIEEAAGIAKYKARKKESLKKIEATQTNLARLVDIVQEIEKNLASLERQAQKAQIYQKYKIELFVQETTWSRRKKKALEVQLSQLEEAYQSIEQKSLEIKAILQVLENTIEVDRTQLMIETKRAEELQEKIQILGQKLSEDRSHLELFKRRQGDLEAQLLSLEEEKRGLSKHLELQQSESDLKFYELDVKREEFENFRENLKEQELKLKQMREASQRIRSSVQENQRKLAQQNQRGHEWESQLASLTGKKEAAFSQLQYMDSQSALQKEKIQLLRDEYALLLQSQDTFLLKKETVLLQKKEQKEALETQEAQLKLAQQKTKEAHQKSTQLQSKWQSLKELDEMWEGFGSGVRSALEWSQKNQAPFQPLTNWIEVSPGCELPLQNWLESHLESLVFSNENEFKEGVLSSAAKAIEHLQVQKQGRISVQLFSLKDSLFQSDSGWALCEFLVERGVELVGEFNQWAQVKEQKLPPSFQHVILLRTSLLTLLKDPLFPWQELFQKGPGWSFVSLDGVVLDARGVLRGGSQESTGALAVVKRKKGLAELKEGVEQAQAELQQATRLEDELQQEMEFSKVQYQTLLSQVQVLEVDCAGSQRDLNQVQRTLRDAEEQEKKSIHHVQQIQVEMTKNAQAQEQLQNQIQSLGVEREKIAVEIETLQQALEEQEGDIQQEEETVQTWKIQEASSRERLTSLERETQGLKTLMEDRNKRLQEIHRILERATKERTQFFEDQPLLQKQVEEALFELAAYQESLNLVKDTIEQLNSGLRTHLEKLKSLHQQNEAFSQEAIRTSIQREKVFGEWTHLVSNLKEKYGENCFEVDLEKERPEVQTLSEESDAVLEEKVQQLRQRIQRLGEVNLGAIEEYEQLKQRHEHLVKERKDLEHSMQNLEEAITHINQTSVERFKKAFQAIAERFERLFPIVFGGGQAKLSLVYPEPPSLIGEDGVVAPQKKKAPDSLEDILEAGVDILAQPPGKKISNMTLLSGGEKALTAVCLIFSIFMVKPSPFCLLDEVDAPLDDANIGKFNALLREMSSKSQFIIITHNKKTMELNETLYGVTMEEPGVSKMVSIQLQNRSSVKNLEITH